MPSGNHAWAHQTYISRALVIVKPFRFNANLRHHCTPSLRVIQVLVFLFYFCTFLVIILCSVSIAVYEPWPWQVLQCKKCVNPLRLALERMFSLFTKIYISEASDRSHGSNPPRCHAHHIDEDEQISNRSIHERLVHANNDKLLHINNE